MEKEYFEQACEYFKNTINPKELAYEFTLVKFGIKEAFITSYFEDITKFDYELFYVSLDRLGGFLVSSKHITSKEFEKLKDIPKYLDVSNRFQDHYSEEKLLFIKFFDLESKALFHRDYSNSKSDMSYSQIIKKFIKYNDFAKKLEVTLELNIEENIFWSSELIETVPEEYLKLNANHISKIITELIPFSKDVIKNKIRTLRNDFKSIRKIITYIFDFNIYSLIILDEINDIKFYNSLEKGLSRKFKKLLLDSILDNNHKEVKRICDLMTIYVEDF